MVSIFLINQPDYILFVHGITLAFLSAISLCIKRLREKERNHWNWLALFGVIYGFALWVEMLGLSLGESSTIKIIRILSPTAFIFLFHFGHSVLYRDENISFPWVRVVSVYAIACGILSYFSGAESGIRYAFSIITGFYILRCLCYRTSGYTKRDSLQPVLGAVLGLYSFTSAFSANKGLSFPASFFNQKTFISFTGIPVEALLTLIVVVSIAILWSQFISRRSSVIKYSNYRNRLQDAWIHGALLIILVIGWIGTRATERYADNEKRNNLLAITKGIAACIDPLEIMKLSGTSSDTDSTTYESLRTNLTLSAESQEDVRYIYLMGYKKGDVLFYIDAEPQAFFDIEDPLEKPGSIYHDASPELVKSFFNGTPFTEGPIEDKWGIWVSGIVPIKEPASGRVVGVLGMDISAEDWAGYLALHRLAPIGITLFLAMILIVYFLARQDMKIAAENLSQSEKRYRTLVETSPNCVCLFDNRGRFISINASGLKKLGLIEENTTGRRFIEIWPDREQPSVRYAVMKVLAGVQNIFEAEYRTGDDRKIVFEAFLSPIMSDNGKVRNFVGILIDITTHKQVEETLRAGERKLRAYINSTSDMVFLKDSEFRHLIANPALCAFFRRTEAEVIGKTDYEIMPGEAADECRKSDIQALKLNDVIIHEECIGEKTFEIRKFPVYLDDGSRGVGAIIREITERKLAEVAIEESRKKYRELIQNANSIILKLDTEGNIIFCNEFAQKFFGYEESEILGENVVGTIVPETETSGRDLKALLTDICMNPKNYAANENENITRDGRRVYVAWTNKAILDNDGNLVGVLCIGNDITARRRAEQEKHDIETKMLQAQKLESLGILAGGIAHDFNNLLVGILGNTDIALTETDPDTLVHKRLHEIGRVARRAAGLAHQMLAYSGKGRFIVEPLNLSEIVREMAEMLQTSISRKAKLHYGLAGDVASVDADINQMRQIIMNLIVNASEALEDNPGEIRLSTGTIECNREYLKNSYLKDELPEGKYTYIEITDTGCGMDEETQGKIFDPFFTTKFTGRGLGLAAVLGIVRGHRGAIHLISKPGEGTTFRVLFPSVEAKPRTVAAKPSVDVKWKGNGTVLIADDEEAVRAVATVMLEKAGFKVLAVSNGLEAVEAMSQSGDIVCVILDLTMPEMDGEQAFLRLRQMRNDLPIILSSGYNQQDVTQRFVGKGLTGFIQKPYEYAFFIGEIKKALESTQQTEIAHT